MWGLKPGQSIPIRGLFPGQEWSLPAPRSPLRQIRSPWVSNDPIRVPKPPGLLRAAAEKFEIVGIHYRHTFAVLLRVGDSDTGSQNAGNLTGSLRNGRCGGRQRRPASAIPAPSARIAGWQPPVLVQAPRHRLLRLRQNPHCHLPGREFCCTG